MTMQRIIQSDINIIKAFRFIVETPCGNIAEENMSDDYESVNDYITEVKKINKLSSDQIQDSQYLMVPYYSYNK